MRIFDDVALLQPEASTHSVEATRAYVCVVPRAEIRDITMDKKGEAITLFIPARWDSSTLAALNQKFIELRVLWPRFWVCSSFYHEFLRWKSSAELNVLVDVGFNFDLATSSAFWNDPSISGSLNSLFYRKGHLKEIPLALQKFASEWPGYLDFATAPSNQPLIPHGPKPKLKILMLYDKTALATAKTFEEYLAAFQMFSRHEILFSHSTGSAVCDFDLSTFDAVIINYSVRVCLEDYFSKSFAEALKAFGGFKALFIQDEYDATEIARKNMDRLGIQTVFTCVPEASIEKVYPRERLPRTEFIPVLTGYVPERLEKMVATTPLEERKIHIGYRGRKLPYWYGELAYEKYRIGVDMKRICAEKGISADIEVDDSKRIYGNAWYQFVESCRAMLGTESGSNLFDFHGHVKATIEEMVRREPEISFEEASRRYLHQFDGQVVMNQISPKVFEAISLGTALILFEGSYSGVLQPDEHYIPLKKDYSNVDEVLRKVADLGHLKQLTQRARRDVVESGKYSYRKFIQFFDQVIDERVLRSNPRRPYFALVGYLEHDAYHFGSLAELSRPSNLLLEKVHMALPVPAAITSPGRPRAETWVFQKTIACVWAVARAWAFVTRGDSARNYFRIIKGLKRTYLGLGRALGRG